MRSVTTFIYIVMSVLISGCASKHLVAELKVDDLVADEGYLILSTTASTLTKEVQYVPKGKYSKKPVYVQTIDPNPDMGYQFGLWKEGGGVAIDQLRVNGKENNKLFVLKLPAGNYQIRRCYMLGERIKLDFRMKVVPGVATYAGTIDTMLIVQKSGEEIESFGVNIKARNDYKGVLKQLMLMNNSPVKSFEAVIMNDKLNLGNTLRFYRRGTPLPAI